MDPVAVHHRADAGVAGRGVERELSAHAEPDGTDPGSVLGRLGNAIERLVVGGYGGVQCKVGVVGGPRHVQRPDVLVALHQDRHVRIPRHQIAAE